MKSNDDPGATYARCLAEEQGHLARLRRWLTWLVRVRIVDLVLGIVLAGEACSRHGHFGLAAAASALVFVALTIAIAVVEHGSKQHEARVRYCEDGLARVQGRPIKGAPDGQRFADPAHPYAADLDIFGPASLFSHLCMARTGTGQTMLARWLTQAAAVGEIGGRQQAVAELSSRLTLRQDLWLAGGTVCERVREDALEDWLSGATTRISRWQRIVTGIIGALGLVVLYAFANPEAIPVAVGIVLVQRLWAQRYRALTKSVEAQVFRRAYELRVIARLIERLCSESFSDPRLLALTAGLSDEGKPASRHILRLVRLVNWLESRRNQLFVIPAVALLLPEQLSFAIEAWRVRHGAAALRWLATIAEMEALASLATFTFEHPLYPFPQIVEHAEPSFVASALGHPLIPAGARVANDVRLDAGCRLLVVTGSNMSGKSTLLRTVGVNAALAQAGAPVCAATMTMTPLQIGASLRAQDSLEAGVSRFFAEIKRLHAILSMATHKPPVLFLLDEILNGTNSQDRREGAEAIIRQLLERGAVGLVTTHDLALSELANTQSSPGSNVHFQDTLEGDRLLFDYRLRPGVVTRRNALDLMRLVGIDVSKS
jgi:MutS domain V